jgi:ribosomal protein S21
MIEVRKRKDENAASLIYRFNKRVMQSGILKEAKKRMYLTRPLNERKRKLSALYRLKKEEELKKLAKFGHL